MAIACPGCETRALVFAIVKGREAHVEQLPTDFIVEDLVSFDRRGPITIDDVLDFHDYLRDFRGDMADLLGDGL